MKILSRILFIFLDWNLLVGTLPLTYTEYNEYNGCWHQIVRDHFDLFMLEVGRPDIYSLLSWHFHLSGALPQPDFDGQPGQYGVHLQGPGHHQRAGILFRPRWPQVKSDHYQFYHFHHYHFRSIVKSKFQNTVACVGNPRLSKGSQGAVVVSLELGNVRQCYYFLLQIEQPFMMTVSADCQNYYVTRPGEEILQGRGRCPKCTAQVSAIITVIVITMHWSYCDPSACSHHNWIMFQERKTSLKS